MKNIDKEKQLTSSTDVDQEDLQHDVMAPDMVQGNYSNTEPYFQEEIVLKQVNTYDNKDQPSMIPAMGTSHIFSQEIENKYKLIYSKDKVDDSKWEHIRDIDNNLNDVFDPGAQADYDMEAFPTLEELKNIVFSMSAHSEAGLDDNESAIMLGWSVKLLPEYQGATNQEETKAALWGLSWCLRNNIQQVILEVDSELLVRWLRE
ncbi:hypothetical protein FXO38_20981 [Capsicum annuum]|nr:hypothetical protein FXO38_20981 [Capsicum annuum]